MDSPPQPVKFNARYHWNLFSGSVGVLILACCFVILPDDRIAFKGFESSPLPHLCPLRAVADINCLTCGLTRSVIHTIHGRFHSAWSLHRLGIPVVLFFGLQIPYRLSVLYHGRSLMESEIRPQYVVWIVLLIFMLNRAVDLI
ncbi:MAG: hypothetical protein Tsb009_06310 [Planctomycetaceae bacterium]